MLRCHNYSVGHWPFLGITTNILQLPAIQDCARIYKKEWPMLQLPMVISNIAHTLMVCKVFYPLVVYLFLFFSISNDGKREKKFFISGKTAGSMISDNVFDAMYSTSDIPQGVTALPVTAKALSLLVSSQSKLSSLRSS